MSTLTVGRSGEIALPKELRERYALKPETRVRVIETQSGILLVPLTEAPMTGELARELEEWQSLGTRAWETFAYDDEP
jgi:AbrB family looped-hinge helix DNA binding protein